MIFISCGRIASAMRTPPDPGYLEGLGLRPSPPAFRLPPPTRRCVDGIFTLPPTQNTFLFTDGSKASVYVRVCVCARVSMCTWKPKDVSRSRSTAGLRVRRAVRKRERARGGDERGGGRGRGRGRKGVLRVRLCRELCCGYTLRARARTQVRARAAKLLYSVK